MRESKAESIKRVAKLIDTVHRCAQVPGFEARMQQQVERFEFELRTELQRLGGPDMQAADHAFAGTNLKAAVSAVLENYHQALNTNLPAHTRAMLTRQAEQFTSFELAA